MASATSSLPGSLHLLPEDSATRSVYLGPRWLGRVYRVGARWQAGQDGPSRRRPEAAARLLVAARAGGGR